MVFVLDFRNHKTCQELRTISLRTQGLGQLFCLKASTERVRPLFCFIFHNSLASVRVDPILSYKSTPEWPICNFFVLYLSIIQQVSGEKTRFFIVVNYSHSFRPRCMELKGRISSWILGVRGLQVICRSSIQDHYIVLTTVTLKVCLFGFRGFFFLWWLVDQERYCYKIIFNLFSTPLAFDEVVVTSTPGKKDREYGHFETRTATDKQILSHLFSLWPPLTDQF